MTSAAVQGCTQGYTEGCTQQGPLYYTLFSKAEKKAPQVALELVRLRKVIRKLVPESDTFRTLFDTFRTLFVFSRTFLSFLPGFSLVLDLVEQKRRFEQC